MFYHPITIKILIAKKNSNKIDGSKVRHKNPQLHLKWNGLSTYYQYTSLSP